MIFFGVNPNGAADADRLIGVGVPKGDLDLDGVAGDLILQCKEFFHVKALASISDGLTRLFHYRAWILAGQWILTGLNAGIGVRYERALLDGHELITGNLRYGPSVALSRIDAA